MKITEKTVNTLAVMMSSGLMDAIHGVDFNTQNWLQILQMINSTKKSEALEKNLTLFLYKNLDNPPPVRTFDECRNIIIKDFTSK